MRIRTSLALTLLVSGVLALSACDGDDDDSLTDTGVTDTGANDTGVNDTGVADMGVRDTGVDGGVMDSGENNCAPNDTIGVGGTDVVVDPATMVPEVRDTNAVLSCRVPPGNPPFTNSYCPVECLDFLGYEPTLEEVQQLELAVYVLFDLSTMMPTGADPTYDRATGIDVDPEHRRPVASVITPVPDTICESGYQLELGFTDLSPTDETLSAEVPYVIRVRSVQTSTPAWVDTYHWAFIRRNDETPAASACGISEARVPGNRYVFPVIHRSVVEEAIGTLGVAVPGAADLDDGLGSGYAILESRDCSSGGGQPMENATLGATPRPIADVYPGTAYELNRTGLFTSEVGHWLAVGFDEMTATSSTALEVAGAVGVTRDETCTEAFAGSTFPVYPDAITFFRFNRENAIED